MHAGLVISFEGISGAGKTTAVRHVDQWLLGADMNVAVKEDLLNYTGEVNDIGRKIKQILDAAAPTFRLGYPFAETLLIIAKRAFESQKRLEPAYRDGAVVLLDRDIDTVCALQLPVLRDLRPNVPEEALIQWIRLTNHLAALEPELTIVLEVDIDESIRREHRKALDDLSEHELEEQRAWCVRLQEDYKKVFAIPLERRTLIYVDANRPLPAVLDSVEQTIEEWFKDRNIRV